MDLIPYRLFSNAPPPAVVRRHVGDKVFACGENSHVLCPVSELADLRAVNANLRRFAANIENATESKTKRKAQGLPFRFGRIVHT